MSIRSMAANLSRSPSTISRELKRNSGEFGYHAFEAESSSRSRKAVYKNKILRHDGLLDLIIGKMQNDRLSPEMIAGQMKSQQRNLRVSHETIYRFVYSQEGQKLELWRHLMRARKRRNLKYGRKNRCEIIPNRVSISQRPEIGKEEFGHFEADTTFFKGNRSINLVTMVDRKTGYLFADLNFNKKSYSTISKLLNNIIKLPKDSVKTITTDNGGEFSMHSEIKKITGIQTYFCHPGSPWERPYVENSHAILHRFLPKNLDATKLTEEIVQNAINMTNNLPRKKLGFKTPQQAINDEILTLVALRS